MNKKGDKKTVKKRRASKKAILNYINEVIENMALKYGFNRIDTSSETDLEIFKKLHKKQYSSLQGLQTVSKEALNMPSELGLILLKSYLGKDMTKFAHPLRVFTSGKHDEGQKKPKSEDNLFHFEIIGSSKHIVENLLLQFIYDSLRKLKVKDVHFEINMVGNKCCKASYKKALNRYVQANYSYLTGDCKKLVKENPFNIFKCDREKYDDIITEAPKVNEYLCDDCKLHLSFVERGLRESGIPYEYTPGLFVDSTYVNGLIFEVKVGNDLLAKGERHDTLIKTIGAKKDVSALGFHLDSHILVDLVQKMTSAVTAPKKPKVFLAHLGEMARLRILKILSDLIAAGVGVNEAIVKDTLRSQLNAAERMGVKWLLILGQKEALEGTIIVKEWNSGVQEVITIENLFRRIKKEKDFLK